MPKSAKSRLKRAKNPMPAFVSAQRCTLHSAPQAGRWMTLCEMTRSAKRIFVFAAACSALNGCMLFDSLFDPPGKGPIAEEWFKRCQPIIDSLENYKTSNHRYPDALSDLVPAYATAVPEEELKQATLQYRMQDESYELTFKYYGPGVNNCVYRPGSKWVCSGYY
jgi:hypothetical protein